MNGSSDLKPWGRSGWRYVWPKQSRTDVLLGVPLSSFNNGFPMSLRFFLIPREAG
jgi:hypothetical protein